MIVYSYSEAKENLSSLLDKADKDGKVLIRKMDGSLFAIVKEKQEKSPLDVTCIKTGATTHDILETIRESRSRGEESE